MGKKYLKDYEIHYYEVDYRLQSTITTIVNFMGDIGTKQSEDLGVGIDSLISKNMTWVFYQYDIKVNRYPKYGEKVKMITEASGFKKFYATRDYIIYDENDNKIVEAKAIFLLINTEKRRAVRVPEEQYIAYGVEGELGKDFKVDRLEKLEEPMYSKEFKIRYSDIDSNRHVNNSKYIEWAIETLPLELVKNYELKRMRVTFEKECLYGEEVRVLTATREENDGTITSIHKIDNSSGKEITALIGEWRKIN